jgi:hypothetical protein
MPERKNFSNGVGRLKHGVRNPQWFLLLIAGPGILSGCRSSRDWGRVACRLR